MSEYNHKDIEKKWQDKWEKDGIYKVQDSVPGKKNFFELVEFIYPSGNAHVGHWYAFSVPDIHARYKRMQGFNVLYPMGFDAFGLPAENAAIKRGRNPKDWTYENIALMRKQLGSMGAMFDWDREIISSDPEYYKWTQWMFNQFLKNDLVYRDVTKVNWCPKDQTILANEQVVDGCCERCGAEVTQREQPQWMLRITKYADRLIDDLDALEWPHAIKEAQKNWIGRSEGSEIEFKIKGDIDLSKIKVFTTRADTLFGVTYVVLAPENPFIEKSILTFVSGCTNKADVEKYISETKKKSELDRQQSKEKTGVELKGIVAINPANGEEIPVWIADYVLAGYGTGAVMAVPAHDERDFEFAEKYNLPGKIVIVGGGSTQQQHWTLENYFDQWNSWYSNPGKLIDSGEFNGLSSEEAKQKITESVGGKMKNTYRLRDWGISRQRYWGVPIPIVYDPEGKAHAVPDEHLPWLLPTDVDHTPDGTAPLARSTELKERTEKIFDVGWKPEVETMDTFVDSSWYFYRYLDPKNSNEFASKEKMASWMPIDLYMGGAEHTTMHLLYSRFWVKAMHDLGMVKETEAYTIRRNRGLILGPDGNKMSKSKGNVIDPDEIVERLGADTVRMYLGFMGPYGVTTSYPWDPNGVVGVRRFLEKIWRYFTLWYEDREKDLKNNDTFYNTGMNENVEPLLQKTIKKITEDIEEYKFNTCISALMILLNDIRKESEKTLNSGQVMHSWVQNPVSDNQMKIILKLLAPFAPHMTEELWYQLGETESIHVSEWPTYDPAKIIESEATIVIQINGKLRGEIKMPMDASRDEVEIQTKNDPKVSAWLLDKEIVKIIHVPNKLVNIVIK